MEPVYVNGSIDPLLEAGSERIVPMSGVVSSSIDCEPQVTSTNTSLSVPVHGPPPPPIILHHNLFTSSSSNMAVINNVNSLNSTTNTSSSVVENSNEFKKQYPMNHVVGMSSKILDFEMKDIKSSSRIGNYNNHIRINHTGNIPTAVPVVPDKSSMDGTSIDMDVQVNNATTNDRNQRMVMELSDADKEKFKQRKRRLKRFCNKITSKYGRTPTFMELLRTNLDISDDENSTEHDNITNNISGTRGHSSLSKHGKNKNKTQGIEQTLPKKIRIDVDLELGLKTDIDPTITTSSSKNDNHKSFYLQGLRTNQSQVEEYTSNGIRNIHKTNQTGKIPIQSSVPVVKTTQPADEGWYEGVANVHLHEDMEYLNPIQQYIRKNIQYFSAIHNELNQVNTGRRCMIIRGRVGIRCIHCAIATKIPGCHIKSMGSYEPTIWSMNQSIPTLPNGAIFYPNSILNLCSNYITKFQSHFAECPNLPDIGKMQFLSILEEMNSNDTNMVPRRTTSISLSSSISADGSRPMSNSMYHVISAKRIGLIEVEDGLRFSRDLNCEPLPFTTIRLKVEHENSIQQLNQSNGSIGDVDHDNIGRSEIRLVADAESEAVLAEAVAKMDGDRLCRIEDKTLLTDYVFLIIRQMALCHATSDDVTARYKKNLLVGYTGFSCRWCLNQQNHADASTTVDLTCRCFPSVSENLSSAISTSFITHVNKCAYIPARIKSALASYKKLHLRQMAQLPYGSQRKFYIILWSRLRASDRINISNPIDRNNIINNVV